MPVVQWYMRFASRLFVGLFVSVNVVFLSETSLSQTKASPSKFLGNVIGSHVPSDFGEYWNQVTPENAGKWGNVAASQDTEQWHWATLDSIYEYALQKGYPFKLHNLVWKEQQPKWLAGLTAPKQKMMIEAWIRLCGERYPKSSLVDVVNEPINKPAFYKEALGGDGTTGWDWVIWCFQEARQCFPNAKLLINEYNILGSREGTERYIRLINLLKKRDLIDGFGCQGHGLEDISIDTIKANLKLLETTGLPAYISEYDVNEADDSTQLAIVKNQFSTFWDDPAVKGITFWGYIQDETWRPSTYLVRADGSARPALEWMEVYVSSHPTKVLHQEE